MPRQASVSVSEQLVNDVLAAGGSLRVPRRRYGDRGGVDFDHRARLAERYGKVPQGRRLSGKAVSPEELQIDLVEAPKGTAVAPRAVPVPDRVGRYHPCGAFRERAERHEVSRAALPRASRILQGLAVEAERRVHRVVVPTPDRARSYERLGWTGPRDGHLVITADACSAALRVTEEGLASRAHWQGQVLYRGSGRADYEAEATGRLSLEIVSGVGRRGRVRKWSDRRSWTLEEKLPEVLREIEIRAAEHRHTLRGGKLRSRHWAETLTVTRLGRRSRRQ